MGGVMSNVDLLKSSTLLKISAFFFVSIVFFYLGKHWSQSDAYQQLLFFSSTTRNPNPSSVSLSPNFNKTFDLSSILNNTARQGQERVVVASSAPPPPPPPPPVVKRMGVVDENGVMTDDFEVGDFDPVVVDDPAGNGNEIKEDEGNSIGVSQTHTFKIRKFGFCPDSMREYIPCMDNLKAIKKLNSTAKDERFERYCPAKDLGLNCLVPPPKGYRTPIGERRKEDGSGGCGHREGEGELKEADGGGGKERGRCLGLLTSFLLFFFFYLILKH